MRRLLYFLMALLGFTVATSCRVEYGCPPVEYDDQKQEQTSNTDSNDRIEADAADDSVVIDE